MDAIYSMRRLSVLESNVAPAVCRLCSYFWYLSFSVSVLSLVLISVDRFVATVFPMKISMMTGRISNFYLAYMDLPYGVLYSPSV